MEQLKGKTKTGSFADEGAGMVATGVPPVAYINRKLEENAQQQKETQVRPRWHVCETRYAR